MNIRLTQHHKKIRILFAEDVYEIMQRVLLRENKIDRNREHLWTICLDTANKILNIELVSLGTVKSTLVEPMEVFSVPLQKRAVQLILVHNHPSGLLEPSEEDKDVTDRLIQVGRIMNVPVVDHLIISTESFYSFSQSGLLAELEKSEKYVPTYELKERYENMVTKAVQNKAEMMALMMKKEGLPVEMIMKVSGLSASEIEALK